MRHFYCHRDHLLDLVFRVFIPLLLSAHQVGVNDAITHNESYRFLLLPVSGKHGQNFQVPSFVNLLLTKRIGPGSGRR